MKAAPADAGPIPDTVKVVLPAQQLKLVGDESDSTGVTLRWSGRREYRTRLPMPRVLIEVPELSDPADTAENLVIEGDNLQVMASLYAQYCGKVDVVLIDPPYNTGQKDFRYSDRRFHDPDADGADAIYVSNEDGGKHTWWLNMMAPRLVAIRDLLADTGLIFIHINGIELFRLGVLMDELFGEDNRVGVIVWWSVTDNNPERIVEEHEYILCYAKKAANLPTEWSTLDDEKKTWILERYEELRLADADPSVIEAGLKAILKKPETREWLGLTLSDFWHVDERGPWREARNTDNPHPGGYLYDVVHPGTGRVHAKPPNGYRFSEQTFQEMLAAGLIVFQSDETKYFRVKKYLTDKDEPFKSVIRLDARSGQNELKKLMGANAFPHPKPTSLEVMLLGAAAGKEALVLDAFAGSATTGHAVMKLNMVDGGQRRYIMIEEGTEHDGFARTLTAERLRRARLQDGLSGGFTFLTVGQAIDESALVGLQRASLSQVILQSDPLGTGGGIRAVSGEHVIGAARRGQAICLCWKGASESIVTTAVLRSAFSEVRQLGLKLPMRIYGSSCEVAETTEFTFCQIPNEILNAYRRSFT